MHLMAWALTLARARAGSSIAARIAIMAITTNSSIKVNALRRLIELGEPNRARLALQAYCRQHFTKNVNPWQSGTHQLCCPLFFFRREMRELRGRGAG